MSEFFLSNLGGKLPVIVAQITDKINHSKKKKTNKQKEIKLNPILQCLCYLTTSQDREMGRDMEGGMDSGNAGAYGDTQIGRDGQTDWPGEKEWREMEENQYITK